MEVNCKTLGWSSLQELQADFFVPFSHFQIFGADDVVCTRIYVREWGGGNDHEKHHQTALLPKNMCLEKPEPFFTCQAVNMHPFSALWDFIVCFSLFVRFCHRYVYCKGSNKNGNEHQWFSLCHIFLKSFLKVSELKRSDVIESF